MKKCPFCKNGVLEEKTVKEIYTYKEHSLEVEQPGKWCDTCGEGILSGEDLTATESEIRDFQAKIDKLAVPGRIRNIFPPVCAIQKHKTSRV
jgi:HTH-type transcriptional regulator/antitoxin MqsA